MEKPINQNLQEKKNLISPFLEKSNLFRKSLFKFNPWEGKGAELLQKQE